MPLRIDDKDLDSDEFLWRRILDKPLDWFTKAGDGTLFVSSAAFKDSLNEVSVNVVSQTTQESVMEGRPTDGLVRLLVQVPRSLDHIVAKTLEPDDPVDHSHRVICPPEDLGKKRRIAAAREMAKAAKWDLYPFSERK